MSSDRIALAEEIEQAFESDPLRMVVLEERDVPIVLAALRADHDAGGAVASDHRLEALKREAQDRAFRHELAESVLKSEREKWLRAGHLAMKGNLIALKRMVERTENSVPIQGSGASQEGSEC